MKKIPQTLFLVPIIFALSACSQEGASGDSAAIVDPPVVANLLAEEG